MAYRVRRASGDLPLASADEVVKAWRGGLVQLDDEVLEEGQSSGVKAREFPGIKPPEVRVRTAEGELAFGSLYEVQKAWKVGLVSPEDEVVEADRPAPVRVKDHPKLHKPEPDRGFFPAYHPIRVGLAIATALFGLIAYSRANLPLAGVLAIAAALQMSSITYVAFKRPAVRR